LGIGLFKKSDFGSNALKITFEFLVVYLKLHRLVEEFLVVLELLLPVQFAITEGTNPEEIKQSGWGI
jgi:hypothetical protein